VPDLGTVYPLANRILDGRLRSMLRRWRTKGLSHAQIAYKLRADHDITVSDETVRMWCLRLGIDEATAPVS
jgi:hypothetical protein